MQKYQDKAHSKPRFQQAFILLGSIWLLCVQAPALGAPKTAQQSAARNDAPGPGQYKSETPPLGHEVKVAGSRVFINEPRGFEPASRFSGLEQASSGATLMVTELPAPFEKVSSGFTLENMAAKGLELEKSEKRKVGKFDALLIDFTQSAYGRKFNKCSLIFGDDSVTVLATATVPQENKEAMTQLKASLDTIRLDDTIAQPPIDEGLPFKIKDGEKLKKASRLQNTIIFTSTGKMQPGHDNGPLFIVGESIAAIKVDNQEEFARKRIFATPHLQNLGIESINKIKQSNLNGIEIIARGEDDRTKKPTLLYQVLLFGDEGYFIFQGLTTRDSEAEMLPEFKSLLQSFNPGTH